VVRLLDPRTGQLLREHAHQQQRGRHRIAPEDRPKRTPVGTVHLLGRAAKTGAHTGILCQGLYDREGQAGVRRIQGVLALAKKYGAARVDEACAAALELEIHNYQFVRKYLERQVEPPLSLRQVDPLIRQLELYRDLIERKSKEP
jgi:hypothetical protein